MGVVSACSPKSFPTIEGSPMQSTDTPTNLLTRREAATYLAISPRKLDALAASGQLPRVRIGSAVRFERCDLDQFIATQKST